MPNNRPLFFKIASAITTLTLVVVLSTTSITMLRSQQSFRRDLQRETSSILNFLERAVGDSLYFEDSETLNDMLRNFADDRRVLMSGRAYNPDGLILGDSVDSSRSLARTPDPLGATLVGEDDVVFEWRNDRLVAGKAVRIGNLVLGAISIERSTDFLNERMAEMRLRGVLTAVFAAAASFVVSLMISRSITRPISTLVDATERIADGDLDRRISVRRQDELGKLSSSVNYMADRIRAARDKLAESERRYSLSIKGAKDGIWDWDLVAGTIFYSPRWMEMVGVSEGALSGTPQEWMDRIHQDDIADFAMNLKAHLTGKVDHFEHEYRLRMPDESYGWFLARGSAVFTAAGEAYRIAGSQTDISDRKETEHELEHQALHDSLTDLPNRTLCIDRLEQLIAVRNRNRNHEEDFAVLFIDLDGFKLVNDVHGHQMGDRLLIMLAERIKRILRPRDTLSRLGGDEFVVILPGIRDGKRIARVSERIQGELTQPHRIDSIDVRVSASVGIVVDNGQYGDAHAIIRDADIAMYRAKSGGKNRHEFFDPEMRSEVTNYLALQHQLQGALEKDEIKVHFQPILSLIDRKPIGFEALLRWTTGGGETIAPGRFVPVAEETGLVVPITTWLLDAVGKQIRSWRSSEIRDQRLVVCVNVSAKDFETPDALPGRITDVIRKYSLDPGLIRIEVTESAILQNVATTVAQLVELRKLGVIIELDDFGTGQSSLSYLHRLPIDILKIDRSFITGMLQNEQSMAIVRAIIALARELGVDVIAEGVESEEQHRRLISIGCRFGQGHLYSAAIPPDMVARWLENHPVKNRNEFG